MMELNPNVLASGESDSAGVMGLFRRDGYSYHPVAHYNFGKHNRCSNGFVAKSPHGVRFPTLAKWVGKPPGSAGDR